MNKAEFVEAVQSQLGDDTSKACAEKAVNAVIDAIKGGVKAAGKQVKIKEGNAEQAVQLVGFGTFSVGVRSARLGKNPQTGEALKIKAAKTVKFKAGAGLKALV